MAKVDSPGAKTKTDYWDAEWTIAPRLRLPSSLNVAVGDVKRILSARVPMGSRVLEIGCAPGKMLAWVATTRKAKVSGLDYSKTGLQHARNLFLRLGIDGDLRCENLFDTTFDPASFDVIFSNGLIEHFDDPRHIVERHVRLLKPGGRAVIIIPNYGGFYGRILRRFDPENLSIHNLAIMKVEALGCLAPTNLVCDIQAYPYGRVSPWIINYPKSWPPLLITALCYVFNGIGLLQPFAIQSLCPMLVLEMTRRVEPHEHRLRIS